MLLRAGNSVLQVSLFHISILLEVVTCYVLYKLSDLEFVKHFLLFCEEDKFQYNPKWKRLLLIFW